jgi:hypothetical protein
MQSRKSGYFLVYRDVWKHKVFKNLIQSSIWLYMISSASHQDKTLKFLDSPISVKRAELIFPLRKNSTIWGISYSEMRTFIMRLKKQGMIAVRLHHLNPTSNHPSRKITIISVINYDKFQYVDDTQPPHDHLSPHTNKQVTNKQILNTVVKKSSKEDYKKVGEEGHYVILRKDNKKYLKHKFKDEPLKAY